MRIGVRVVGFGFSRPRRIISATYWYEKSEHRPKTASKMAFEPALTRPLADESLADDGVVFLRKRKLLDKSGGEETGVSVKLRSFQSGRETKRK